MWGRRKKTETRKEGKQLVKSRCKASNRAEIDSPWGVRGKNACHCRTHCGGKVKETATRIERRGGEQMSQGHQTPLKEQAKKRSQIKEWDCLDGRTADIGEKKERSLTEGYS